MKKTLIALAAVASTAAFAQSTVTISGAVGAEYSRTTAAGNNAQLNNPDAAANNITFSGSEDLGGGLKANFYLQQRFNGVTGESGNTGVASTLTDSNSDTVNVSTPRGVQNIYVGLSGGFGSVIVGRFLTGPSGAYDAFGQYGANTTDYADAGTVGARNDRTIQYTSPNFNGFSATVAMTNDNALAQQYQYIRATYAAGPLSVSFAQERNTTAAAGTDQDFGASYDFGVAKAMLLMGKTGAGVTNTAIGVRMPMGAATIKAALRSGDSPRSFALGVDYSLSKRTGLFADYGSVDTAGNQSAYRVGVKHSF